MNGSAPDWPTPRAGSLDGGSNSRARAERDGIGLEATTRSLNPDWVAQLMGFPSDWCHLSDREAFKLYVENSGARKFARRIAFLGESMPSPAAAA